jgi:hypothetical protein
MPTISASSDAIGSMAVLALCVMAFLSLNPRDSGHSSTIKIGPYASPVPPQWPHLTSGAFASEKSSPVPLHFAQSNPNHPLMILLCRLNPLPRSVPSGNQSSGHISPAPPFERVTIFSSLCVSWLFFPLQHFLDCSFNPRGSAFACGSAFHINSLTQ